MDLNNPYNDRSEQVDTAGPLPAVDGERKVPAAPDHSAQIEDARTVHDRDPSFEVDWEGEGDPANPKNWPLANKAMVIGVVSVSSLIVVLYSTAYTSGTSQMAAEFDTSDTVVTLGLTLYLLGLAIGSVVLAPLSELYGRKPVALVALALFTVFIVPAALSHSITSLIVVRFIGSLAGSVMVAIAPGMVTDVVYPEHQSLALSIWSIGPFNGPVIGPVIGGFVTQYLGWRWMNWIVLMLMGVSLVSFLPMRETYGPVLLRRKAARLRQESGDTRWWCRFDQKTSLMDILRNLRRPFVMAFTEPICIFWNVYISIIYGILYLCFVAYPIVFQDLRGWSEGLSGLSFLGLSIGTLITVFCEPLCRRLINRHRKDPQTGQVPPEALVSVVSIAAILVPIGELWFAWTCYPYSIPWIVPILAGIPFAAGNTGVFIYAQSYLVRSYGVYAASALAGNSVMRSIMGAVLPLAGQPMYSRLGPNWAGTLLGLLEVAIIPIPIVFYKYGAAIRRRSTLIRQMMEDKDLEETDRQINSEKT